MKSFPFYSSYQYSGNRPIWKIDLDGLEDADSEANQEKDKSTETGKKAAATAPKTKDAATSATASTPVDGATPATPAAANEPNKVTLDAGHGDNNSGNSQYDPGAVDGTH